VICVICKKADTQPGTTSVMLERNGLTLVIKDVPAQICPNCGEDYIDESVAGELLQHAEELAQSGTQVEIRQYATV